MGISDTLRRILNRNKTLGAPAVPEPEERSVDSTLMIEATRLVETTRAATKTLFIRQLYVTGDVADQLLRRLEHCEVLTAHLHGRGRRIITTPQQLTGVIEEFKRRDAVDQDASS